MKTDYEKLLNEMFDKYHQAIYDTIPHNQLEPFLNDFLALYAEKHPFKKPTFIRIGDSEYFDPGDIDF